MPPLRHGLFSHALMRSKLKKCLGFHILMCTLLIEIIDVYYLYAFTKEWKINSTVNRLGTFELCALTRVNCSVIILANKLHKARRTGCTADFSGHLLFCGFTTHLKWISGRVVGK